jgi:large subunit ribosomal protein L23
MKSSILIKPVISEKTERLSGKLSQYTFVVHKQANKIEIKNAVEKHYGVSVERINTCIVASKAKSRSTRAGVLKGSVSAFKKAIVTLKEGEELDFFGE